VTGCTITPSTPVDTASIPTVDILFPIVEVVETLFEILELLSALLEERFDPPPTSPTSSTDVFLSTFVTKAFTWKPTAPAVTNNLSATRRLCTLSVVPVGPMLGGTLSRRSDASVVDI
jgi:hypothetical protein